MVSKMSKVSKKMIMIVQIVLLSILCLVVVNSQEPHPCVRACDGEPMICRYHFVVETYSTMDAMACYDCPRTPEDCYRPDCLVAGGYQRNIVSVNRKFPGPTIEVCENDIIEVLLENQQMSDEPTTIHWHGQTVKATPYMDGVPWITQCPVLAGQNFTYRLVADVPGTHFWHSHERMQRGDGMFGMLIVNVPKSDDLHADLYDEDLSEHQISIIDWTRKSRIDTFGMFWHGGLLPTPDAILINGLGYMDLVNIDLGLPIAEFHVQKGKRYRFRFVNAEFFDCPCTVSFDNHKLTVISSDGHDIKPRVVDSFNIFAGERYDIVLHANQSEDAYWIRVRGLGRCEANKIFQVAILRYEKSENDRPTADFPAYETAAPSNGIQLNPLIGNEPKTIQVDELRSANPCEEELSTENVYRKYIKLSFNPVENPIPYRPPYYGLYNVSENLQFFTPSINDINFKEPSKPLMPNRYHFKSTDFCTNKTVYRKKNCAVENCHCTHVVQLPLNRVVELIIFDQTVRPAHHPLHLHGNSFRVVAWKRLGKNISKAEIEDLDRRGLIERNLEDPALKDTVAVPRGGYAIVRFKADNPGYWFFHCHVDIHAEDGMRMVFKVGSNDDMLPTPLGLPSCWNGK